MCLYIILCCFTWYVYSTFIFKFYHCLLKGDIIIKVSVSKKILFVLWIHQIYTFSFVGNLFVLFSSMWGCVQQDNTTTPTHMNQYTHMFSCANLNVYKISISCVLLCIFVNTININWTSALILLWCGKFNQNKLNIICECCCFLVKSISPTCNLCLSVVLVCKVNQHICKLWLTNQLKLKIWVEFNCKSVFDVVTVRQIPSGQTEQCVWVVCLFVLFCRLHEFSFLFYV